MHLANFVVGRARKFYFWRRDSRHLFVSDSWYCQIQSTRLIMFFVLLFSTNLEKVILLFQQSGLVREGFAFPKCVRPPFYLLFSPFYLLFLPFYLLFSPFYLLFPPCFLLFPPIYLLFPPFYLLFPCFSWLPRDCVGEPRLYQCIQGNQGTA